MEQRVGKLNRWIAALFLCLAAGLCALAGTLFVRAETMDIPVPDGPEGPGAVLEEFFACLEARDWEGAAALTADGTVPVPAPTESRSALLWAAQQKCWHFEIAPGYEEALGSLGRRVTVTAPDLDLIREPVLSIVQSGLERALEAATFKNEVYDEEGRYREELVFSYLEAALRETVGDLSPYCRAREMTVKLVWIDGKWRVKADGEMAAALTGGAVRTAESAHCTEAYEQYVNNLGSAALEGLVAVPKVYKLSEGTVVAPEPDKEGFGSSENPADTAAVIAAAEPLLAGQSLLWTPETSVGKGGVSWYRDETILVLCWKQKVNKMPFSFMEVVVAHPSQFRRYFADNDFASKHRYRPSQMAEMVNAVGAMSGDFFKYRRHGIVVYQREVYRAEGETLDTCFVDSDGDFHFVHRGELVSRDTVEQYVKDNDILFSFAFGPIMIEDGRNVVPKGYPVGQITDEYTRSVICQLGKGHYLMAVVCYSEERRATLKNVAKELISLGVPNAYALDGGQTAAMTFNNQALAVNNWDAERTVSDILYFATAIPDRD